MTVTVLARSRALASLTSSRKATSSVRCAGDHPASA